MRILLVEDDARTATFVVKGLQQAGYNIVHAANGRDGLLKAKSEKFSLAIVDIMLPDLDGFSLIEEIREEKLDMPIIVLSARSSVDDKIKGLQKGSDDYLAKPFSFAELLARIQALLRRPSALSEPTKLSVSDLTIDLQTRKVLRGGEKIELQPLEYVLLEYLMRNAGRVVSKTMITEQVWDYNFDPQTNVVETRICRLRDKIDREFPKKLIHTVRGVGYVLEERP